MYLDTYSKRNRELSVNEMREKQQTPSKIKIAEL